jgi:transcriptional regulator with XRE-family HTH domain
MKIAAITRFKNGDIYGLLQKVGWTQTELARRAAINQTTLGQIVRMVRRPSEKTANQIQRAFAEVGEYIDVLAMWPEGFCLRGKRTIAQIKEVDTALLSDYSARQEMMLEDAAPAVPGDFDRSALLPYLLSKLSDRDKEIVEADLDEEDPHQVARRLGISYKRVLQVKHNAVWKMRYAAHSREFTA